METTGDIALGEWMGNHGHLCWILFGLLIIPNIHLYIQLHWVRKAGGMRKGGDGIWKFAKPRQKPHKPELRDAQESDFHDAKTPKNQP